MISLTKNGGLRVLRVGSFTIMWCRRKKTDAQRDHEKLRKRAKRLHRNYLVREGAKALWASEQERAFNLGVDKAIADWQIEARANS